MPEFRRVLVALDTAGGGTEVLDLAARLAVDCEAELAAVVVENTDLLQLAELPFIREVDRLLGVAREIDTARVSRLLRTEAARARRSLEDLAQRLNLRTSFQVLRGRYIEAALQASAELDLLLLDRGQPSVTAIKQIVVIDEDAAHGGVVMETAWLLARARGARLAVLEIGAAPAAQRYARTDAGLRAQRLHTSVGSIEDAAVELLRIQPDLVVLPRDSEFVRREQLGRLTRTLRAPLLLVPTSRPPDTR